MPSTHLLYILVWQISIPKGMLILIYIIFFFFNFSSNKYQNFHHSKIGPIDGSHAYVH